MLLSPNGITQSGGVKRQGTKGSERSLLSDKGNG